MKKINNKKGFTIVELVIVIAVIAILAAVLIPTFSGVVEKANETAALEKANNAKTAVLVKNEGRLDDAYFAVSHNNKIYWYAYKNGSLEKAENAYDVSSTPAESAVYISKQDVNLATDAKTILTLKDSTPASTIFTVTAGSETPSADGNTSSITAIKVTTGQTTNVLSVDWVEDIASGVVIIVPKTGN